MKKKLKFITTTLSAILLSNLFFYSSVAATVKRPNIDISKYSETTIYYNGDIVTVDDKNPKAEAVLVGDGKILSVGSWKDILKLRSNYTRLVNLEGKTMLPGFVDAHSHVSMVGQYDDYSPTQGISTIDELVSLGQSNFNKWYDESVKNGTYEDGDWYVGMGYDNTTYPEAKQPSADDMDKISTDTPICIIHTSSHIAIVNHKALEILGYTKGSELVSYLGENIETDSEGNPTGIIKEDAFFMLYYKPNVLYDNTKTNTGDYVDTLEKSMNTYASYGITTAQDGSPSKILDTIEKMEKQGKEPIIDINSYVSKENMTSSSKDAVRTNRLKRAGVKIILDGSPQAKTAWFNEPYYVVPDGKNADYSGYASKSDDEVYEEIVACLKGGYQMEAHANGTAAIDQFINQYEKAKKDTGITTDLRPVLIHAQTITEEQLDRAEEVGVNVSFFNDHVYYWGDYHLSSVLGPVRAARISPLASAIKREINVTMHQDSPVILPNMLFSIHNAVNRVTRDGVELGKEFAVDPLTAIKFVTINSAYQSFEEDTKGSIEVGKLADFVILDKNPLTVQRDEIKNIKVMETIKEDKTIYSLDK